MEHLTEPTKNDLEIDQTSNQNKTNQPTEVTPTINIIQSEQTAPQRNYISKIYYAIITYMTTYMYYLFSTYLKRF